MLSPKEGQYFLIAAFVIAILFVIAIFAIIGYWVRRIRKNRSKKNIENHDDEIGDKESTKEQRVDEVSSENEDTEISEDIMTMAMIKGIRLIVYSCMPKLRPFKVLLAQSWQPGTDPRVGVFNHGKTIKKGTVFGPYQPEKEFFLIQIKKRNKYQKGIKKLEQANNWLGLINKAARNDINVNIIQRTDDGTYFYEATRNILHGEEILALFCWSESSEKKY